MKEIYRNNYGASFIVENHPNPKYILQLVIHNIGIFMSLEEIENLLKVVCSSYDKLGNCNCEHCKSKELNRLWKVNSFFEIYLKIDTTILNLLKDLIEGTQFILNIDEVLKEHKIHK